jgi:hypothetical protein
MFVHGYKKLQSSHMHSVLWAGHFDLENEGGPLEIVHGSLVVRGPGV